MPKFRKKPVVIEAIKFIGGYIFEGTIPDWLHNAIQQGVVSADSSGANLIIKTLEGDHTAIPGDFIIQGVKGELYPCKPDIFEATYESVED